MNIADIVKTARERNELIVFELAAKAGINPGTIYNIEAGRVSPRMDTVVAIMRILDYDIIFNPRYKGGYIDE